MNRLAASTSAYLQSAAHQPIHWFPWGAEAFTAAREADKPLLLDVGAVWCHWCHVMDGESYEDPALAAFLNEHFVCVKVDRDERPDVDARYQRAVQALTGQGGWPLTAFLTPDGEAFYGGTYFPPEGMYQRPSFRTVLGAVLDAYRSRRDQVQAQATAIRRVVLQSLDEAAPGTASADVLETAADTIARHFDPVNGGFGTQPKFPHPAALVFMMHRWHDQQSPQARTIVEHTLSAMASGGIHDQLGGGFHRYSVDAEWVVPHFEKMSYDNSELLEAYVDAYALFGAERYADVARGIVRWVREVASDPDGGYAASQDADVGLHDDGDYFTWTRDEAAAVLTSDELEIAVAHYDIGTAGEMHHNPAKNVLYVAASPAAIARRMGRGEAETVQLLASAQAKMLAARAQRPAPFVDRTRYTNWNAMMASAMLRAGAVLDEPWATEHALRTLRRLRDDNAASDAVAHTPGGLVGLLDDQVQTAAAALDAFETTGDERWLTWAERIMDRVWTDYHDDSGGALFDVAAELAGAGTGLAPARAKPVQDAPAPSGNGVAGIVCARLYELTQAPRWRERAAEIVATFAGRAHELGLYAATYLLAADWQVNRALHLVIVGAADDDVAARMHQIALAHAAPRRVVQWVRPEAASARPLPPALAGMRAAGTAPRGYACSGDRCSAPAGDEATWQATLDELSRERTNQA